jgi:hypothetical protein
LGTDYTTLAPRRRATGLTVGAGESAAIPDPSMLRPDEAVGSDCQDATDTAQDSENLEVIAVRR